MGPRPLLVSAPRRVRSTWRAWALRLGLGLPALAVASFAFWEVATNAQSLRRTVDPLLRSDGRVVEGRLLEVRSTDPRWRVEYEAGGRVHRRFEDVQADRAAEVARAIAEAAPDALDVLRRWEGTSTDDADAARDTFARRVTVHYRRDDPSAFHTRGDAPHDDAWRWTFGRVLEVEEPLHEATVVFALDGAEHRRVVTRRGERVPASWPAAGGAVDVRVLPADPERAVTTHEVPVVRLALRPDELGPPSLGLLAALAILALIEVPLARARRMLRTGREGRATVLAVVPTHAGCQNAFTALAEAAGDGALPVATTYVVRFGFRRQGRRYDGRARLSGRLLDGVREGETLPILLPPQGARGAVPLCKVLTWARPICGRPARNPRANGRRGERAPHAEANPSPHSP